MATTGVAVGGCCHKRALPSHQPSSLRAVSLDNSWSVILCWLKVFFRKTNNTFYMVRSDGC